MITTPIRALRLHAQLRPNGIAFISGNEAWTYERFEGEVRRLARGLSGRGLQKGDRVALHMANLPELAIAYYACFQIGAIAAPLNTRFKTAELTPILRQLKPALYIGQARLYGEIAAIESSILKADRRFIADGAASDPRAQPWTALLADGPARPIAAPPDIDAPAVLLCTSGTTGEPKFVIHTLASISETSALFSNLALDGEQIAVIALPMVHASGFFFFLACMRFGARIILLEQFEPNAALDAIERHRGTWTAGLPFMIAGMLECQRACPRDGGSLRTCMVGGDVCPPLLQQEFPYYFGTPLRSFWAASEAVGSLTFGLESGAVSRVARGAEVRLVSGEGVPVPQGEIGELQLRGPNVSAGYWDGPGKIKDTPQNGWYRTGDLMRQDGKGNLWFVSRRKELIIRGGSNISPTEVERALLAHPAVQDAGVVGVPDEVLGERVAGAVQLVGEMQNVSAGEILAATRRRLADYKVPERLEITAAIPRNALGKIDRKALRIMLSDESGSAAAYRQVPRF